MEGVVQAVSKKYKIQTEPSRFYAGSIIIAPQVLMGISFPYPITLVFDAAGNYVKTLKKKISQEMREGAESRDVRQRFAVLDEARESLEEWKEELGFEDRVISVYKFSLPEYDIFIADLPVVYQELLDSGEEIDEDTLELIREWRQELDYVFIWENDYDMDQDGKVVSS